MYIFVYILSLVIETEISIISTIESGVTEQMSAKNGKLLQAIPMEKIL